jgi:hypothetical protein
MRPEPEVDQTASGIEQGQAAQRGWRVKCADPFKANRAIKEFQRAANAMR